MFLPKPSPAQTASISLRSPPSGGLSFPQNFLFHFVVLCFIRFFSFFFFRFLYISHRYRCCLVVHPTTLSSNMGLFVGLIVNLVLLLIPIGVSLGTLFGMHAFEGERK